MHLACPKCAAVNRVPEDRLQDNPVCGVCKTALAAAEPFALTDLTFKSYIEHTEGLIVVDFWASWCGPCRTMAPQFEVAANQLPRVRFAKVDTDAEPYTAGQCAIRSIPSLLVFSGGNEIARQAGAMRAADIVRWLESLSRG
ncbi:MAG: thioredoxin TrxC [Burkholderiales bacterium]|nr:thioredoxin TrxC [Burkholderiales bacterium]